MIIVKYKDKTFEDCFRNKMKAVKRWGNDVGLRYIKVMTAVYATEKKSDFYLIPQFRFHSLKGKRKNQFGIDIIKKRVRLVVEFENDTTIKIMEVNTTHYE